MAQARSNSVGRDHGLPEGGRRRREGSRGKVRGSPGEALPRPQIPVARHRRRAGTPQANPGVRRAGELWLHHRPHPAFRRGSAVGEPRRRRAAGAAGSRLRHAAVPLAGRAAEHQGIRDRSPREPRRASGVCWADRRADPGEPVVHTSRLQSAIAPGSPCRTWILAATGRRCSCGRASPTTCRGRWSKVCSTSSAAALRGAPSSSTMPSRLSSTATRPPTADGKWPAGSKKIREPFLFGLDPAETPEFLSARTLHTVSDLGPEDLATTYLKSQGWPLRSA